MSSSDANDLDLLIDAVVAAHAARGAVAPRKVWPEPLGSYVDLVDFVCVASLTRIFPLWVVSGTVF